MNKLKNILISLKTKKISKTKNKNEVSSLVQVFIIKKLVLLQTKIMTNHSTDYMKNEKWQYQVQQKK